MTNLPNHVLRWADEIAPELRQRGIVTNEVVPLAVGIIIARLGRDYDWPDEPMSADRWDDFVFELLEEHPTWEDPEHKVRRIRTYHATELLNAWSANNQGRGDDVEDLLACKYASVWWYNGESAVYGAGDLYDLIGLYVQQTFEAEYPEMLDHVVDLDTGRKAPVEFSTTMTVHATLDGQSLERTFT